jgi:hypothetical protein
VNCRERLCCPTARSGVSRAGQSRRLVRRRGDALRRSSGFRPRVLPPFNIEESEWPPEPCAPQKTPTQSRTTDFCQRSHPGPPRVSSPPVLGTADALLAPPQDQRGRHHRRGLRRSADWVPDQGQVLERRGKVRRSTASFLTARKTTSTSTS